ILSSICNTVYYITQFFRVQLSIFKHAIALCNPFWLNISNSVNIHDTVQWTAHFNISINIYDTVQLESSGVQWTGHFNMNMTQSTWSPVESSELLSLSLDFSSLILSPVESSGVQSVCRSPTGLCGGEKSIG